MTSSASYYLLGLLGLLTFAPLSFLNNFFACLDQFPSSMAHSLHLKSEDFAGTMINTYSVYSKALLKHWSK